MKRQLTFGWIRDALDDEHVPVFDKEQTVIKEKSRLRDLLRKLFFFAVFYGVVFGQIETEASYNITIGMEKVLKERRTPENINFHEIYNRTQINTWIYENLPTETINIGDVGDE